MGIQVKMKKWKILLFCINSITLNEKISNFKKRKDTKFWRLKSWFDCNNLKPPSALSIPRINARVARETSEICSPKSLITWRVPCGVHYAGYSCGLKWNWWNLIGLEFSVKNFLLLYKTSFPNHGWKKKRTNRPRRAAPESVVEEKSFGRAASHQFLYMTLIQIFS